MKKLADAWNWYEATKRNLQQMQRLGAKHWNNAFSEGASIWQDDVFKKLEASDIVSEAMVSLAPLDDVAVFVLFSVFEAQVRDYLTKRVGPEAAGLVDPILKAAAVEAIQGVKEGSFYTNVLEPLKRQKHFTQNLVEHVNQVRRYRNWVAHGRRNREEEEKSGNVTPRVAYERLKDFLAVLGIDAESEAPPTVADDGDGV